MFGGLSLITEPLKNGFGLLIDEFGIEKVEGLDAGGCRSPFAYVQIPIGCVKGIEISILANPLSELEDRSLIGFEIANKGLMLSVEIGQRVREWMATASGFIQLSAKCQNRISDLLRIQASAIARHR